MGLAGEHELDRPLSDAQQARQPLGFAEEQFWPLVAGEPAGESDRERVGVEHRAGGDDARRAGLVLRPALARPFADEVEERGAERLPGGPEIFVRDFQDT